STSCSLTAIPPRQPLSVALHRPIESPAPPALSNLVLGTSSSLAAFPLTSPRPLRPAGRRADPHLRARRPQPRRQSRRRFVAASPIGPQQHAHVVPPCLCPFLVRPPILQHDPGLAASPPACYTLKVARSEISLPLSSAEN